MHLTCATGYALTPWLLLLLAPTAVWSPPMNALRKSAGWCAREGLAALAAHGFLLRVCARLSEVRERRSSSSGGGGGGGGGGGDRVDHHRAQGGRRRTLTLCFFVALGMQLSLASALWPHMTYARRSYPLVLVRVNSIASLGWSKEEELE